MDQAGLRVLVVEDDPNLGTILSEYLEAKGYQSTLCPDGEAGFTEFAKGDYDFCIFDVMMPKKDGFTLAKEVRKINPKVPIIFLTAKSMKEDTIEGFASGADDYITKPFSMEELLARMAAILRRSNTGTGDGQRNIFEIGQFTYDYNHQTLAVEEVKVKLTSKENELMRLLSINLNRVLDRTMALQAVWEDDSYFASRSMDVYISKLRKHLKADPAVEIVNVHGQGFKLMVN